VVFSSLNDHDFFRQFRFSPPSFTKPQLSTSFWKIFFKKFLIFAKSRLEKGFFETFYKKAFALLSEPSYTKSLIAKNKCNKRVKRRLAPILTKTLVDLHVLFAQCMPSSFVLQFIIKMTRFLRIRRPENSPDYYASCLLIDIVLDKGW